MATFTLNDADGKPHRYNVTPHPADEGVDLSLWFLAHLGGMVTGLLPALRGVLADLIGDQPAGTVSEVLDVTIDPAKILESLGRALGPDAGEAVARELRTALLSREAKPVLMGLFKYAIRDEAKVPTVFALAYQANYLEMWQAAWRIIGVNGFFGWRSTSTTGSAT